jgi:hypothetical protein
MKEIKNRFIRDALDRLAEEMREDEQISSTEILFRLKLRNGKPLHKSRYIGGENAQRQAQSLCFSLKRHPKYYKSKERVNGKKPPLWSVRNEN